MSSWGLLKFMHRVDIAKAHDWRSIDPSDKNSPAVPGAVDAVCGFCNFHVALTCDSYVHDSNTKSVCMKGVCRRCGKVSTILLAGCKAWTSHQQGAKAGEFWILPRPALRELVIDRSSVPEDIFEAYEEAVGNFNDGRWRGVVTECGRALEGVTQDKFQSKEERKILQQISSNTKDKEPVKTILFSPILKLSSAIRLGRLTGAHFNIKGKANQEVASKVLDMTEYLIRYFYELTRDAEALEKMIESISSAQVTSTDLDED